MSTDGKKVASTDSFYVGDGGGDYGSGTLRNTAALAFDGKVLKIVLGFGRTEYPNMVRYIEATRQSDGSFKGKLPEYVAHYSSYSTDYCTKTKPIYWGTVTLRK